MKLKGLESLSILKKQMQEDDKKSKMHSTSNKTFTFADETDIEERRKKREEHRAQVKAAKKQYECDILEECQSDTFTTVKAVITPEFNEVPTIIKANVDRSITEEELLERNRLWQIKRDAEIAAIAAKNKAAREAQERKRREEMVVSPSVNNSANVNSSANHKTEEFNRKRAESQELRKKSANLQVKISAVTRGVESFTSQVNLCQSKLVNKELEIKKEEERIHSGGSSTMDRIGRISQSIDKHRKIEQERYIRIPAIARVNSTDSGVMWITNCESNDKYGSPLTTDGPVWSKNSKIGIDIIRYMYDGVGSSRYIDGTQWTNYSIGIKELVFRLSGENQRFEYQSLRLLLESLDIDDYKLRLLQRERLLLIRDRDNYAKKVNQAKSDLQNAKLKKAEIDKKIAELDKELQNEEDIAEQVIKEEEKRRLEEEHRLREEEEKAKKEIEQRIQLEQEQKAQEEKIIESEIKELESKIEEQKEKIRVARSFIREDYSLRAQHFLDPKQEEAKRSHFFDGTPVIINGGPGTGKTTTIIQRLKFLLSPEAYRDHKHPLTKKQVDNLLDSNTIDLKWLFISPTRQLLHYLRNNMIVEGLRATENNTKTMEKFRSDMFSHYKFSSQFKLVEYDEDEQYEPLIIDYLTAISEFETYVVEYVKKSILEVCELKSSDFEWHNMAVRVKSSCKRMESVNTLNDLISTLMLIKNNEADNISKIEQVLKDDIIRFCFKIYKYVNDNVEIRSKIEDTFANWKKDKIKANNDEDEYVDDRTAYVDFKSEFNAKIRPLIRKISLSKFHDTKELSTKEQEIYKIIKSIIDAEIKSEDDFVEKQYNALKEIKDDNFTKEKTLHERIGENAVFMQNFASPCRGIEHNLFERIPVIYKEFRNYALDTQSGIYDCKVLEKLLKKNNGRRLHPDELDFLVGYINGISRNIGLKNKTLFQTLKHKYIVAYTEQKKTIIGVDEATDYTMLDYYLITSFLDYEYSSLTLCGDIMQGLNKYGVSKWKELEPIIGKNIDIVNLKTSYRQLPTLVDMSRQMYFDDQGVEAPYESSKARTGNDPQPLCYVSDDEDDKAEWIAERIHEIYLDYDMHMPSVAIFLGKYDSDNTPKKFIKRLKEYDQYLNGIKIEDCTDNRQAEGTDLVRVFYLSEVKGMEFEVAIFHNIDKAFEDEDDNLIRRYLYVGISRATTHLAATFEQEDGNESIIKYFDRNATGWL